MADLPEQYICITLASSELCGAVSGRQCERLRESGQDGG